ncbi:MAG: hypothetical protein ACRCZ2_03870 [Fusobacteriaceae bacterium]
MKKIIIGLLVALTIVGCTNTKIINGKEQTFVGFVILNSQSVNTPKTWGELGGDYFPVLRLKKWVGIND